MTKQSERRSVSQHTMVDQTFERLSNLPFADGLFTHTGRITTYEYEKLKNGTKCTYLPVHESSQIPENLIKAMNKEMNYVIVEGRTYPYHQTMDFDEFVKYWFYGFTAILVEGEYTSETLPWDISESEWLQRLLGMFYVKPNYIGRCSHVCNAGFVVNHEKRAQGIGRKLAEKYVEWGPRLGYTYSVFNLVFETNVASLRLWDQLGFDRIGYVPGVAVLNGEDHLVGAYIFGKLFV